MPWPASRLSGRNCGGAGFRATPRLLIRNIGNDDRSALLCVNYFVTRPQPLMRTTMAASTPVSGPIWRSQESFLWGNYGLVVARALGGMGPIAHTVSYRSRRRHERAVSVAQ